MYALRRAPRSCLRLVSARGNATQAVPDASAVTAAPPPPPPAAQTAQKPPPTPAPRPASSKQPQTDAKASETTPEKTGGRQRSSRSVFATHRPSITLARPRPYSRPIGFGVLPAYDEALKYIEEDSVKLKKELKGLKAALAQAQASQEPEAAAEVARLTEKIHIIEVQSEINLPSVRWKARNGLADLRKPVYRRLIEQRWREEGALDMVMERVHQMSVVPDLLPELHPSFDLRVNFPQLLKGKLREENRTKRKYEKMDPGIFLLPEQTRKPPMMYTTVFHTEPRLYTLLMVDLDVPDPENNGFQPYLHWLQPNISLHAFSESPIPLGGTHTPYIPPHPQRGTPYHRYVLLFAPQQSHTERIKVAPQERLGFNYRAFAEEYGLDASKGGGVFMWREIWDETVSQIYRDTLKMEEPVYGRIPKPDPYAALKATKKY